VQSRKLPPTAPAPVEKPETVEPAQAAAEASDVGPIGAENGVIGGGGPGAQGNTASAPAPHPPTPARPADLATVRSGIARTLVYPPEARRRGWQGRVTLAFTLQADGTVLDLTVRQSSGLPLLDQAALAAIRRAAPFAPPGLDVQVVVPVVFRFS